MNEWVKRTLGVSAAGLFVLYAANGKALADALLASWLFLLKLVTTAPLGLGSFALALALTIGAQAYLQHVLCPKIRPRMRELILSLVSLVVGFGVMFLQVRTVNGALLGLLCGFGGPFAYQAIAAVAGMLRRAVKP